MKIRIRGNSIRLRLTKTEIEAFCKTGIYKEKTAFNSGVFNYQLKAQEGISALQATFIDNTITILAPLEETKDWFSNTKIGYENKVTLDSGEELTLLIEKDFVCMDETIEDQSDNYPNPKI